MTEKVVWQLLQPYARAAGVPGIAPHDLRRSCAKVCRAAGGELEQIQLLLGHESVQMTERYLGTKQDPVHAPNDGIKVKVVCDFAITDWRVYIRRRSVRTLDCRPNCGRNNPG